VLQLGLLLPLQKEASASSPNRVSFCFDITCIFALKGQVTEKSLD
jgi:hypothetical protein